MPERLHIAVVDDEDDLLQALRRLLGASGYVVETYSSGTDFLHSLEDHTPDCVLLDLQMPGMTGFEVQKRLSADGYRFPVVIISANDDIKTRIRAMEAGAVEFLGKPMDADHLLASIEQATGVPHPDSGAGHRPRRDRGDA